MKNHQKGVGLLECLVVMFISAVLVLCVTKSQVVISDQFVVAKQRQEATVFVQSKISEIKIQGKDSSGQDTVEGTVGNYALVWNSEMLETGGKLVTVTATWEHKGKESKVAMESVLDSLDKDAAFRLQQGLAQDIQKMPSSS